MTCQYVYPNTPGMRLDGLAGRECGALRNADCHEPAAHMTCTGSLRDSCMYHEYVPEAEVESIDIRPSDEGFAAIMRTFTKQIVDDVKAARLTADRELFAEVVKIAFYLGQKGRTDLITPLVKRLSE